ncbi:MAG: DUF58 domain-containing protein [Porticoccaceae bacterium]
MNKTLASTSALKTSPSARKTSPKKEEGLFGIAVPDIAALVALRHGARQLSLFPRRQAMAATAGNYRSRFRGRGMDFDEVRPYQPGDDIRTIDWRVTARTTKTHTKVFREERERPVVIAVDLRSSMFFGSRRLKSLVAAEIATTLAWAGLRANDRIGGMIFSPEQQRDLRSRRSHHNVLQFIHSLSAACEELLDFGDDKLSLTQVFEDIRRAVSPGTSVVIISDFHGLDHEGEKQLFQLVRHCDLSLACVRDPLETALPPPGIYRVSDGVNQQQLHTGDSKIRAHFHNTQLRQQQLLEAVSTRIGAGLMSFSTKDPVLPELMKHYSSRNSHHRGRRGR